MNPQPLAAPAAVSGQSLRAVRRVCRGCGSGGLVAALVVAAAGCGQQPEVRAPEKPKNESFPVQRYIPNDAVSILYVNVERLNSSFYGPYIQRVVNTNWGVDVGHDPIFSHCRHVYLAVHGSLRENRDTYGLLAGQGE